MKYQSYKELYKQNFTIPVKFLDDFNIDFGKVVVFFVLMVINSILFGILALGGKSVLFIPRPILAFALTCIEMLLLIRVPTAGKPLIVWLFYVVYFSFFVPKETRAFKPVKLQKKIKEDWSASFRSVTAADNQIFFNDIPLLGQVEKFDGLSLQTHGATRLKFYPFSKKLKVQVGDYEKLKRQTTPLRLMRPTTIEVGRGSLRVLKRQGKSEIQYIPFTEMED